MNALVTIAAPERFCASQAVVSEDRYTVEGQLQRLPWAELVHFGHVLLGVLADTLSIDPKQISLVPHLTTISSVASIAIDLRAKAAVGLTEQARASVYAFGQAAVDGGQQLDLAPGVSAELQPSMLQVVERHAQSYCKAG